MGIIFPLYAPIPLGDIVPQASRLGVQFMEGLLKWNPLSRLTAQAALGLAYFQVHFKLVFLKLLLLLISYVYRTLGRTLSIYEQNK